MCGCPCKANKLCGISKGDFTAPIAEPSTLAALASQDGSVIHSGRRGIEMNRSELLPKGLRAIRVTIELRARAGVSHERETNIDLIEGR
jgi:hypothetical protein